MQLNEFFLKEDVTINTNEMNEKMVFDMYGKLIMPLRRFEETCDERNKMILEIGEADETIRSAFFVPIISAILLAIRLAIPFAIVFWIATNILHNSDGVRYADIFFQWEEECKLVVWLGDIGQNISPLFMIIIFAILEFIVIPSAIVLFPMLFLLFAVCTIVSVISSKRVISRNRPLLEDLDDKIDIMAEQLSCYVSIIPPDYRYSEAVDFFYNSYCNCKVTTIREAVLLYDQYCHMKKIERTQEKIFQGQKEYLQEIQMQNIELSEMNSRLRSIEWNTFWA